MMSYIMMSDVMWRSSPRTRTRLSDGDVMSSLRRPVVRALVMRRHPTIDAMHGTASSNVFDCDPVLLPLLSKFDFAVMIFNQSNSNTSIKEQMEGLRPESPLLSPRTRRFRGSAQPP